ncbi:hypothetical protein PanWU01x14_123800 [Parasponia andersonii]|uniref:Uncharacterized protein n=1 Tax=Parasponia andersonii TaxID=3476 RepID=A0A2P5CTW8_PARAD|nr:hypothetical protein PanWU01x14_123800 [Parasponia andersonii]
MNARLSEPFCVEEIKDAVNNIGSTKAPGLDGFHAVFYQKHWNVVGDKVANIYPNILNEGHNMRELNKTHIVLIPKIANPKRASDYRPIILNNVVYNIITKVLTNRLKGILLSIISYTQSRLISDNTLSLDL